ncbi:hypothetical protein OS965_36665 [Streptomyces sp. H27-G5]|nr:hypothetical protein [Streptomyces sp. H27-G5]MCY0923613.1 hypothetical protein [Streptomyces sp. H27-G5]
MSSRRALSTSCGLPRAVVKRRLRRFWEIWEKRPGITGQGP